MNKEIYYIFILVVLVLFLKFQYEEVMNDAKNNIVEQIRKSRHKSWSSNFNLLKKCRVYILWTRFILRFCLW